jgi:hypothetical protein
MDRLHQKYNQKEELDLRHYGAYDSNGRVYAIAKPTTKPVSPFSVKTFPDRQAVETFVQELTFLRFSLKESWFWVLKDNECLTEEELHTGTLNGQPRTQETSQARIIDLVATGQLAVFPLNKYIPPADRTHHLPRTAGSTQRSKGDDVPANGPGDRPMTLGPHSTGEFVPVSGKGQLQTKQMDESWAGEHLPNNKQWGGPGVTYLNEAERANYELKTKDGKLYDAQGKPFDTRDAKSAHPGGKGKAIFVMDEYGSIFASNRHSPGEFHHSSFLAGRPVAAAGEIEVSEGALRTISDRSRHYKPEPVLLDQACKTLGDRGIDMVSVTRQSWL